MKLTEQILAGNLKAIENRLFEKAAFVVESSVTPLMEQRDAPDQSAYPLTRREVEKMLTKFERREDDSTGIDNPEARSIEGMKRVRWYAPEQDSDFVDEFIDGATGEKRNLDDRPSKMMPYDYRFTVHKPGDINISQAHEVGDADTSNDSEDWEGGFNRYFESADSPKTIDDEYAHQERAYRAKTGKTPPANWEVKQAHQNYHAFRKNNFDEHGNMVDKKKQAKLHKTFMDTVDQHGMTTRLHEDSGVSVEDKIDDASSSDIVNLFHDSAKNHYPIELHLDDNSYVSIEPHHAQHFINAGKADDVPNYMKSAGHFKELLKSVYSTIGDKDD